jgi:ATP-dependent DNA helicase RecG
MAFDKKRNRKAFSVKDAPLRQTDEPDLPLTRLKGVGPKRALALARKGLHTILDLLYFTPLRYEDRTRISTLSDADDGFPVLVKGRVLSGGEEKFYPSRKRLFKIYIRAQGSVLELLWFQYKKPHLLKLAAPDTELLSYGVITTNRGKRQMIHPEIAVASEGSENGLGFYPVYSSIKGISTNILRSMIKAALDEYLMTVTDPIPKEILHRIGLPDLPSSVKQVHFPSEKLSVERLNRFNTPFHKRLIFDRFFVVMLTIAFRRKYRERRQAPVFSIPSRLREDLKRVFPFKLTPDQIKAVEDFIEDFSLGKPMNRLLLGDVGCGKTVVAAVAAYIGIRNALQVALMVPTQVLARQHMEYFSDLSPKMGFRPVLLAGGLKTGDRQDAYDGIRGGWYNLIVGTQSLIQEKLSFPKLGLVIIDEQHRFGVRERALMCRKGENPHLLVMTATPIPRTLAITVYGDMDVSVIKSYPVGHMPVITRVVSRREKRRVFHILRKKMSAGQQAFVICPVIEGSEDSDLKNAVDMAEGLRKILSPPFRIGLVHGRLAPNEREQAMEDFRKGMINLLVATTVIEVGVHVPRATVMVIEHPERFGLAQIHQLRGRIGRGSERGMCLLMVNDNLPDTARTRLETLVETHDGFEIAQKDFELRGHGELIGMRQAGMGELDFAEMMRESDLLLKAQQEAKRLVDYDPKLTRPENGRLRIMLESVLSRPLDL